MPRVLKRFCFPPTDKYGHRDAERWITSLAVAGTFLNAMVLSHRVTAHHVHVLICNSQRVLYFNPLMSEGSAPSRSPLLSQA